MEVRLLFYNPQSHTYIYFNLFPVLGSLLCLFLEHQCSCPTGSALLGCYIPLDTLYILRCFCQNVCFDISFLLPDGFAYENNNKQLVCILLPLLWTPNNSKWVPLIVLDHFCIFSAALHSKRTQHFFSACCCSSPFRYFLAVLHCLHIYFFSFTMPSHTSL